MGGNHFGGFLFYRKNGPVSQKIHTPTIPMPNVYFFLNNKYFNYRAMLTFHNVPWENNE